MSPLYLGDTAISKVYKGSTELAQNYLGSNTMLSTGCTEDCFAVLAYTGDRPTNAPKTGMGLQPDIVLIKDRGASDFWSILDSNRGANVLSIDDTMSESSFSGWSFDSDGFTVGSSGQANSNGNSLISYGFKVNGGTTYSNTSGSITSTVQANNAQGISIVTYTGDGANGTVGHGLNSAPELIITKKRNGTSNWSVSGTIAGLIPGTNKLVLNTNNAKANDTNEVLAIGSTTFTAGASSAVGQSGGNFVGYCFKSVSGFQKLSSYTGTGSSRSVTGVGFQPDFLIIKDTASTEQWYLWDSVRGASKYLHPNLPGAEGTDATSRLTSFDSDGFSLGTDPGVNASGRTYLYIAIKKSN